VGPQEEVVAVVAIKVVVMTKAATALRLRSSSAAPRLSKGEAVVINAPHLRSSGHLSAPRLPSRTTSAKARSPMVSKATTSRFDA
jgi:hypothetical protein